jgi:hypothetical protein
LTLPLTRLWRTLEELPQRAAERLEWRLRLGDEWSVASRLLRSTGRLVRAVACPSPRGDGCPRKIVRHGDGRIVAVCGDRPPRCEKLDLHPDVEVLELDEPILCRELRRLLALDEPRVHFPLTKLAYVGTIPARAGLGLSVLVGFPSMDVPITAHDIPTLSVGEMPGLILTPTGSFVDGLPSGWSSLSLGEILGADDSRSIVAREAAPALLDELKAKAMAMSTFSHDVIWRLPPDARWEEMVFEFTAVDVLNIRFRGESRSFDAQQLDMKRNRTGKPTSQWTLLQGFAENDGEISWSSTGADPTVKKQKQLLSDKLIKAFGIADNPINWVKRSNTYRTKFKISGTPLGFRHARNARR